MADFAKEILPVSLEAEMEQSYLSYAMSVIVGRALPDVRDGLKPVHRRVLYAMTQLGLDYNKPFKKSARVCGDTTGKYHPHGETAVYDALVRMAQKFSMRYPLIDGQGNFGSIDGDAAAAMRYTEVRLSKIAHELLVDLEKDTVDMQPNYDESEREPSVFPARIPNLLVNGAQGIAVGMATNIPPHNLKEILAACLALLENPDLSVSELMQWVPGPDFPTGATISGAAGIRQAYETGRGRLVLRAKSHIEEEDFSRAIIITELPYQTNKARLIEKIAELVKEKKLEGISDLRDESDKDGLRIYIEVKRGESPEVVLNHLYQQTPLQSIFSINMVALVDGQPRQISLKEALSAFLRHRREVITRRTLFELARARHRAHLLEGLAVALANLDEMILLIRNAANPTEARHALLNRSWNAGVVAILLAEKGAEHSQPLDLEPDRGLTETGYLLYETQAKAILELSLQRLTGLEREKIEGDYRQLLEQISELLRILTDNQRLVEVLRDEFLALQNDFGDVRKTQILEDHTQFHRRDFIEPEDVVVTLSHVGYVKYQSLSSYRTQKRGGRGKSATNMREEDFIEKLFIANTHDTLLCFSNRGRVYWLSVYDLPEGNPQSRGKPIVNLLPLQEGERISALLPIKQFDDDHFTFFATAKGVVKKTPLSEYSRPRNAGIIAVDLRENDELIGVALTDGQRNIMLFSDAGKAIRFDESDVRPMGRNTAGVRGISLGNEHRVVSLLVVSEEGDVMTVTANGFGKRSPATEYPKRGRGGQGVIAIQTNERNGNVAGALQVDEQHDLMLITNAGVLVRIPVADIRAMGRNTQGVKLMNLQNNSRIIAVERIEIDDGEPSE